MVSSCSYCYLYYHGPWSAEHCKNTEQKTVLISKCLQCECDKRDNTEYGEMELIQNTMQERGLAQEVVNAT